MNTAELKPLMESLAPIKQIGAHLEDLSYAVSVQDIHWSEAGEVRILSGRHCLIELGEPPPAAGVTGRARYRIETADGEEHEVGAVNFMPPGTSLTIRWSPGLRHSVVCLIEPERLGLLGGIDWHWGSYDAARALNVQNEKLRTSMAWLAQETASPSFASHLQTTSLLTMLAIELRRHCTHATEPEPVPTGQLSPRQLNVVMGMVEAPTEPIGPSLASLAAASGLPGRELSTLFKRTTGQTLRSYVAATHIARAKLLLSDPDLLIKQVAYRSGFRSAAAFGDAFRRATGLTPLQYRERQGIRHCEPETCCD
jgi:AraC family transcriptional regulator